jgi:hypothetical protein
LLKLPQQAQQQNKTVGAAAAIQQQQQQQRPALLLCHQPLVLPLAVTQGYCCWQTTLLSCKLLAAAAT